MRLMGIAALGPKPKTSKAAPGHKIYPYLVRDVTIERAMGGRHHLHSDRARLSLSRGDHRLGVARGACVAAVEHDRRFVLPVGARGDSGEVRQVRDFNTDGREAARGIAEWIAFYNDRCPTLPRCRPPPGAGTNEMRMSAAESAPGAAWHAKGCYESRMWYAVGEKSDPERLRCSRISLAN